MKFIRLISPAVNTPIKHCTVFVLLCTHLTHICTTQLCEMRQSYSRSPTYVPHHMHARTDYRTIAAGPCQSWCLRVAEEFRPHYRCRSLQRLPPRVSNIPHPPRQPGTSNLHDALQSSWTTHLFISEPVRDLGRMYEWRCLPLRADVRDDEEQTG